MRIFGLTGGIACGKSAVTKEVGALGVTVLDCDLIAREVVMPGTTGLNKIVKCFGAKVLQEAPGAHFLIQLTNRVVGWHPRPQKTGVTGIRL